MAENFRERKRGGWRYGLDEVYSIFVRNLPEKLDHFGLGGIFQRAGRVCGTYIPIRRDWKGRGRFGFVRFGELKDAKECIRQFNGKWIRGNRIYVDMAKPKKQLQTYSAPREMRQTRRWQERFTQANTVDNERAKPNQGSQPGMISLSGNKNADNEVWLQRSLVCTTSEPRDIASLSSALLGNYGHCVKVSTLSSMKFLLTFNTMDEMEEALANQEELHQWFVEIKRWAIEEFCNNRRVWLNIMGVPPHGWTWENFKQIAELWGDLICLGKSSTITDSFEVMRVLVATRVFRRIDSEILLQVDTGGYKVTIREAETVAQVLQNPKLSMHSNSIEDKDSNSGVPGFEDIEGIDACISSQRKFDEEGEGSPEKIDNLNSNSNGTAGNRVNDQDQHVSISSRTKTASFSHIGNSEEIFKIARQLRKADKEKINAEREMVVKEALVSNSQDTVSAPPGFEDAKDSKVNSQAKAKTQMESQQRRDGNRKETSTPQSSNTNETTESMLRIAQESLQVGELLGVRVIGNKKGAVKRITDHLKEKKAQRKSSVKLTKQQI